MIDTERHNIDIDPTSDDESFKVEESDINKVDVNGNTSQKSDRTLSSDEITAQGIYILYCRL